MLKHFGRSVAAIICIVILALTAPAVAQPAAFPTKPITLIVPFAAGGATDIVARLVAKHMSEDIGQNLVIENRTGGAGNIGTLAAVRSQPDGYTLVLATTTQVVNQYLMKDLPFDVFNDLTPVALIADAPEILAVTASLPVNTLLEFAEAARKSRIGFNYGSPGVGSVPHLGGEILGKAIGTKMTHVPFRGSADAVREVAAGNIQLTVTTHASAASLMDAGKIKPLAAAAKQRISSLPNVPTTAEAGIPGIELSNWFGIMGPRGLSPQLVSFLNSAFNKALAHSDTSSALKAQGIEPVRETAQQFADRLQADGQAYRQILADIGLLAR